MNQSDQAKLHAAYGDYNGTWYSDVKHWYLNVNLTK